MPEVFGAAKFLWLLASPSKRRARAVYDALSTRNNLGEESLYLNLGYWDGARTYDAACQALAGLLAESAGLKAGDEVLDCGFGFADQDFYWAKAFSPKRIVGLNITASQVELARRRVAERGLEDRVDLREGSATAMPFGPASFDRVVALETAFHYDTREEFFREAYRVLRPGGRLATADIVPLRDMGSYGWSERVALYFGRAFWQIPRENMYPPGVYAEKLRRARFTNVRVRSIRENVYPPFVAFARARLEEPEMSRRLHPLIRAFWKASVKGGSGFQALDYIVASAAKPAASRKPGLEK